jgi:hypothetical protein
MSAVRRVNGCFNCLKCTVPPHTTRDCPSQFRCKKCNKKHHTALHRTPGDQGRPSGGAGPPPNRPAPRQQTVADALAAGNAVASAQAENRDGDRGSTGVGGYVTNSSSKVLLQTALVDIYNAANGRSMRGRALIDQGSHMSHITDEVCDTLDLPVLNTETLKVSVFGRQESTTNTVNVVEFTLCGNGGNQTTMTACSMNHVCNPLPPVQINDNVKRELRILI